ncbi:putative RING-H2 finger protein ATL69 [Vitis vinifera]|uniref:RING-type E3 ubiquitin transferase n=1 Tax=Vitis vinifera TaxID=29760 RepID=A0A438J555_VITVI|nr:putative RING-H2 finger protein ATL69 [Vitis vinifera]
MPRLLMKFVCFSFTGLPRSAKYGLIIGIGIPGLLCLIGISCCICGRIRTYARRRHRSDTDFAISIGPLPAVVMMGLDGPTIESYPKTVLGESMRLPKPSDGTCPICLSEYQPKDTIRTIPECNHCFHVDCVDEWLKMNPTCPVCRNSPDASSLGTPCSSVSSSAILSSSPSSTSLS